MYMSPLTTSRRFTVRLLPPSLPGGRFGPLALSGTHLDDGERSPGSSESMRGYFQPHKTAMFATTG
jgi:hypothetical protein